MAYDSPLGETFILVIPQALYLGEHISYSLLCPNQLRYNGIIVDDVPRHLAPDPNQATHSIYDPVTNLRIPLEMKGVISLFHTRRPSASEIEECPWVLLTSELDWDPHSLRHLLIRFRVVLIGTNDGFKGWFNSLQE